MQPSLSLYDQLKQRQIGIHNKKSAIAAARSAYKHITPNHTIYKVQTPNDIIILRFTPDGKYLICFSNMLDELLLYNLKTCVYPWQDNNDLMGNCFDHFFHLKYRQPINIPEGHFLCKDFYLITNNIKYIILASSKVVYAPLNRRSLYPTSLDDIKILNDYTFYSIDLETGQLISQFTLSSDFLHLNHHACVSLYEQMFAILSLKHQTIKILLIDLQGKFHELRSIGNYLYPDDELMISKQEDNEMQYIYQQQEQEQEQNKQSQSRSTINKKFQNSTEIKLDPSVSTETDNTPIGITGYTLDNLSYGNENLFQQSTADDSQTKNQVYGSFQQAFLSKLFKMATMKNDGVSLQQYYRNFNVYSSMRYWRMQYLNEQKILIKLVSSTTSLISTTEALNHLIIFVIFNLETSQIDEIFDNSNERIIDLFVEYGNTLRGPPPTGIRWYGSHCGNNHKAKAMLNRQLHTWICSKQGSYSEGIKRLSMELPIQCQTYMDCPYFDLNLYSFDEKLILPTDNKLRTNDEVIKFYSSGTHELIFKVDPNPYPTLRQNSSHILRRMSNMIPHPFYPFIITRQFSNNYSQTINFHVYKPDIT
ncbi:unnamed protein product [Cunninghamella echinulata]